jgi:hypothetical protein
MTNQLIALLDGREVGTVHYKDSRRQTKPFLS